jgi:hypothetical protein
MRSLGTGMARRRLVSVALGAVSAIAPAALAGGARAATLTVDKPCYVLASKKPPAVIVGGAGYVPGDPVLITSSDGSVDANATANAAGAVLVQTTAPIPVFTAPGAKTVTLTAEDDSLSGPVTATTSVVASVLGVLHGATKKAQGLRALTEKTRWSFSGFATGKFIYAHYTLKKKQVARQRFGRAQGPCGLLNVRAKLYPATPHHKSYPVQYDSSKRYSTHSVPSVVGRVSLVFGF